MSALHTYRSALMQTKAVTLQAGTKVDLTYADGGEYAFTNGADESKLTLGADNVLTINGDMVSVNVKVGSVKAASASVKLFVSSPTNTLYLLFSASQVILAA